MAQDHGTAVAGVAARVAIGKCEPVNKVIQLVEQAAKHAIAAAAAADSQDTRRVDKILQVTTSMQSRVNAAVSRVLRTEAAIAAKHAAFSKKQHAVTPPPVSHDQKQQRMGQEASWAVVCTPLTG